MAMLVHDKLMAESDMLIQKYFTIIICTLYVPWTVLRYHPNLVSLFFTVLHPYYSYLCYIFIIFLYFEL